LARLVQQALPVHKVQLALKVQLDRRGRKAFKEIKVQLVQLVQQVQLVRRAQ
jgi:hypothetical protein